MSDTRPENDAPPSIMHMPSYTELEALVKFYRARLGQAAVWFQQYADSHMAMRKLDKATRNQERADYCRWGSGGSAQDAGGLPSVQADAPASSIGNRLEHR